MTFLEYAHQHLVPIKLVDKRKSWLMRVVNFFLTIGNALRITNIRDNPHTERDESFMGGYGTTIGHGIYYSPAWPWDMEPCSFMVHELTHAEQASFKQAVRYVFSARWRMFYEGECVQAEILCFPGRRSEIWFARRVAQFVKYGIKEKIVREELTKCIEELKRGEPRASASHVASLYARWRREYAS